MLRIDLQNCTAIRRLILACKRRYGEIGEACKRKAEQTRRLRRGARSGEEGSWALRPARPLASTRARYCSRLSLASRRHLERWGELGRYGETSLPLVGGTLSPAPLLPTTLPTASLGSSTYDWLERVLSCGTLRSPTASRWGRRHPQVDERCLGGV